MFKERKLKLNYLTITAMISIISCIHISSPVPQNTGGIYGKITLNRTKKSFDNVKIQVEETGLSSNVDSSGIFYIPEVPPGLYTLIASAPEFLDGILENVFVVRDSISIVSIWLEDARRPTISEKKTWKGIKTGKVDVKSKGKIKGHVEKSETASPVKAMVCIENTFWVTYTDSSGEYQLTNILPGKYTLKAFGGGRRIRWTDAGPGPEEGTRLVKPKNSNRHKMTAEHYYPRTIKNVRVAPDSTSIVDIQLWSRGIPESPSPIEWKENIIKE